MSAAVVMFWMLVGHAVADFGLQSEWVAKYKNPSNASPAPPGQRQEPVWVSIMSAHSLMHGGAVALATGSPLLGCLETAAHFWIDWMKCRNFFGPTLDQQLHVGCKFLWAALWVVGVK